MNHLTTREIFQIVDGTIANGERTKLVAHLEACQRCRQEVQFQRTLGQTVRELPFVKPSRGFTARIVGKIAPEAKKSWILKIVDNLGNIMAMGLVLGVVWYAVNASSASKSSAEPSGFSKAVAVYLEFYAKVREVASKEIVTVVGEKKKEQSSNGENVAMLTLISLLILVSIDRFVVRRLIKIRP